MTTIWRRPYLFVFAVCFFAEKYGNFEFLFQLLDSLFVCQSTYFKHFPSSEIQEEKLVQALCSVCVRQQLKHVRVLEPLVAELSYNLRCEFVVHIERKKRVCFFFKLIGTEPRLPQSKF
jgi:hypothetical protein